MPSVFYCIKKYYPDYKKQLDIATVTYWRDLCVSGTPLLQMASMFGISRKVIARTIRKVFPDFVPPGKQKSGKWSIEYNREYKRAWHLKRIRGISVDMYTEMYTRQNGCCAICRIKHSKLNVDHDHATGAVRGLLCNLCNIGLGNMNDAAPLLTSAIDYLSATRTPTIKQIKVRRKKHERITTSMREYHRNWHLHNFYGISNRDYTRMLTEQNSVCAICYTKPKERINKKRAILMGTFSVDHDHVTGAVRGLLCNSCNLGIGAFKDSCTSLRAAMVYLEKHSRDREIRPRHSAVVTQ